MHKLRNLQKIQKTQKLQKIQIFQKLWVETYLDISQIDLAHLIFSKSASELILIWGSPIFLRI